MSENQKVEGLSQQDLRCHLADILAKHIEEAKIEPSQLNRMSKVAFQKLAGPTGKITFTDFVGSCTEDDIINFRSIARLFGGKEKVRKLQTLMDDAHTHMQFMMRNARMSTRTIASGNDVQGRTRTRTDSVRPGRTRMDTDGHERTCADTDRRGRTRTDTDASGTSHASSASRSGPSHLSSPSLMRPKPPSEIEPNITVDHRPQSQEMMLPLPCQRTAISLGNCHSEEFHQRLTSLERIDSERRLACLEAALASAVSSEGSGPPLARRLDALEASTKAQLAPVHELDCKLQQTAKAIEQQAAELAVLRFETVAQLEQELKAALAKLEDSLATLTWHCSSLEGCHTQQDQQQQRELPSAELMKFISEDPLSEHQPAYPDILVNGGHRSCCSTPPRAVDTKAEEPLRPPPRGIGKTSNRCLTTVRPLSDCRCSSACAYRPRHPTLARALSPRKEAGWDKFDNLPMIAHPNLGDSLRHHCSWRNYVNRRQDFQGRATASHERVVANAMCPRGQSEPRLHAAVASVSTRSAV